MAQWTKFRLLMERLITIQFQRDPHSAVCSMLCAVSSGKCAVCSVQCTLCSIGKFCIKAQGTDFSATAINLGLGQVDSFLNNFLSCVFVEYEAQFRHPKPI